MKQELMVYGHKILLWFDYSFSANNPESLRKGCFHVILDDDGKAPKRMETLGKKDAERFVLFGAREEEYVGNNTCYQLNQLETLTLLLEAIGKLAFRETWVWVVRPSQLPCLYDKNMLMGDKLYTNKRDHLFEQMVKDIKRIGACYNLNVVLVDNRELIGEKNSALVERLFI